MNTLKLQHLLAISTLVGIMSASNSVSAQELSCTENNFNKAISYTDKLVKDAAKAEEYFSKCRTYPDAMLLVDLDDMPKFLADRLNEGQKAKEFLLAARKHYNKSLNYWTDLSSSCEGKNANTARKVFKSTYNEYNKIFNGDFTLFEDGYFLLEGISECIDTVEGILKN